MESKPEIKSYRDLTVWKKSMRLALATYHVTQKLPREERYGLTSQVRRAAVSVAANIAEGHGRSHRGDYLHHLSIARGSVRELETHLYLIRGLRYGDRQEVRVTLLLCDEIARMLTALMRTLGS